METKLTTKAEQGLSLFTVALDVVETEINDNKDLLTEFKYKIGEIGIDLLDPVDAGRSLGMLAINLANRRREPKKFGFAYDLGLIILNDRFSGNDLLIAKSLFESKFPLDYVLDRKDLS